MNPIFFEIFETLECVDVAIPNDTKGIHQMVASLVVHNRRSLVLVQVSWSGVPNATVADVIVLYVPASADITQLVPAKYKWANQSPGYLSGSGSLV